MEASSGYFEDLDFLTQEVITDVFVSIPENGRLRRGKEVDDEAGSDLCEIEQRSSQCVM
jgi:hypothetical protein